MENSSRIQKTMTSQNFGPIRIALQDARGNLNFIKLTYEFSSQNQTIEKIQLPVQGTQ
jgi:hypothetical protein